MTKRDRKDLLDAWRLIRVENGGVESCPWCKSMELYRFANIAVMECHGCGASGPNKEGVIAYDSKHTVEWLIETWNQRESVNNGLFSMVVNIKDEYALAEPCPFCGELEYGLTECLNCHARGPEKWNGKWVGTGSFTDFVDAWNGDRGL